MSTFQDFSVIQILREINFGESESSRTAIFANLGSVNDELVNSSTKKVQKLVEI